MSLSNAGVEVWWQGRLYQNDPVTGGLVFDENGNITNEELWHDPNINEGTNFNVICDNGALLVLNTMFGLAGSGTYTCMAAGACSTAAVHTDTHLNYEFSWLSGGRKVLTNTDGTALTSAKAVGLSTYNDTTYTPSYTYYTLAQVMATWNGTSDSSVQNQPFQEFGINTLTSLPASPTSTSGTQFDHYVFASPVTLTASTTLAVTASIRLV